MDRNFLMDRKLFYILEGKEPKNCDFWEFMAADRTNWRIKVSEPVPGVEVSTVFLGFNLDWINVKPVCFETMVFGGKHHLAKVRNTSYDDAIVDHDTWCLKLIDENDGQGAQSLPVKNKTVKQ